MSTQTKKRRHEQETFRIRDRKLVFDPKRQCPMIINECEELIDGRWEGFVSTEKARCNFIQLSRAWYGQAHLQDNEYADDVMFGYYDSEGGSHGEISMRWYSL